ncbi:MAG: hypothetical protein U5N86_00790 [Planctomycetota bacterium]|nr:hypothetical protein [Planctomycetota bacterium]
MKKLLEFKFGWLNKERLLFLLGILVLLVGLFSYVTAGEPNVRPPQELLFTADEQAMGETPEAFPFEQISQIQWPETERQLFTLLDAPQLDLPAPEPPELDVPLAAPPAFPQPASSGNKNIYKEGGDK